MPKTDSKLSRGPVIVDIEGTALTDAERLRLQHPLVGGVIIFARNFESRAQLKQLCKEIRRLRKPRLLICVDHEGGRVQRFLKGFTKIPSMRELGRQWDEDVLGACRRATEIGRTIGEELRAVGVDLSFTPVLDLDWGPSSVIGDRAFHSDPRVVAMLARCLNHGLLLGGMGNCGKHFPGHGFAHGDSHFELPIDERELDAILADDAAPYHWLGDTLLSVMPAHVIYPKVDEKPAGFSKRWLQEILRGRLGFKGLIFSDDLTMEGASGAGDIVARACAAFEAGCDMVLVCNRPDLADELLARLPWSRPKGFDKRLGALFRD
ncbi:MAG: beta-N-acetylhexosaminidase [Lautropia sp. SCN 70-15]|nr:MAG: beta-N-acetylhexosaminidase [Lautropia sp. SCN 70-15]